MGDTVTEVPVCSMPCFKCLEFKKNNIFLQVIEISSADPGETERKYEGTAEFFLVSEGKKKLAFTSRFTLILPPNEGGIITVESVDTEIFKEILPEILHGQHFVIFSMQGRLDDGFCISIEEMGATNPNRYKIFSSTRIWREGIAPETVQVRYGLTNLAFTGCYYFAEGDATPRLDALTINIDEVLVELRKRSEYNTIVEGLLKERVSQVTSEAICTIPFEQKEEWCERLDQLSWLMSLASCENVVVLYADYYDGTTLIASDLFPRPRTPFAGRSPTIPIHCPNPCCFRQFLENAFPLMRKYQDKIKLRKLIHLTVTSQHPLLTLEEKFQIGIMVLESFCSHTIERMRRAERPPIRSIYRARAEIKAVLEESGIELDDSIVEKISRRTAFNHPDFKDKLEFALREFSIIYSKDDLSLVPDRNEIVHYGRFKKASDPVERYFDLSNLLIRILLTILDYRGEYIKPGPIYKPIELPR